MKFLSFGESLNEPEGVTAAGDSLWIADANNDRIIRYERSSNRLIPWNIPEDKLDADPPPCKRALNVNKYWIAYGYTHII
ncbi:MAG: hypothetical protein ABW185_26315 [Sedimenticola sp.]